MLTRNSEREVPIKRDLVEVEDIEARDVSKTYIFLLYMLEESLEKYVQKWVLVDNQLTILQEKIKTMREWKKKLNEKIMEIMVEQKIEHKILSIPNGELSLQEKREYSSLSYGFIEECLDEMIPNKEKVDIIMDYLRDHREIKTVKEIRRKNILSSK